MRKSGWIILVAAAVALTGCGEPPDAESEILFLRTSRGIAFVEPGGAPPTLSSEAIPTRDWSIVVRASTKAGMTEVTATNPGTGNLFWKRSLEGRLSVKAVSEEGDLVALGPARESYYGTGRRATMLTVIGPSLSGPRTYELEGNFEPEAFSLDGSTLFVIQYRPAGAPSRYQVRQLDLDTGEIGGVYTVDAELQRSMRGTARIQQSSPDGDRLYTLYTQGEGADRHAFIHVLSLDELWAHCIDLPEEFGSSPESAIALTVSPDGRLLYVTDTAEGLIAEIDTENLSVLRTAHVGLGSGRGARAAYGGGKLFVANGRVLSSIDVSDLTVARWWSMSDQINGLQVAGDGRRIFVGLKRGIAELDASSGRRLSLMDIAGVGRIRQLGPTPTPLGEIRTKVVCGC